MLSIGRLEGVTVWETVLAYRPIMQSYLYAFVIEGTSKGGYYFNDAALRERKRDSVE